MTNAKDKRAVSNGNSMHHTYPVPHTSTPAPNYTPRFGRLFAHIACAGTMINGFLGLNGIAGEKEIEAQYGGFFQYLTIIGLMASCIVMILASINDLLPGVRPATTLKRTLLLFALPVEIVIASIYWTLVFTKPDLMFPPNPDLVSSPEPSASTSSDLLFRIPLWMDLSMHALPAVSLIIEFFTFERRYSPPASTYGAITLAVAFGTAYSLWVEYCATINGKFPYPFLTVMTPPQRVIMYVFSVGLSLGAFWGLNALHR